MKTLLFRQMAAACVKNTVGPVQCSIRQLSNLPETTVYGGPSPQLPAKRVTLRHLSSKFVKKEPITMAGIDICLVGDSVGMVVHGHDTTLPVTMEDMLLHCRAVARGARRPLLVGDMPFGSYEQSPQHAVSNAIRLLKEGLMDAVKIEGGGPSRVAAAKAIVDAGVAVMGHVGLTPQSISTLGGFRPQGRSASGAIQVVEHALALQEAGCFALVVECTPPPVSAAVSAALDIPTIGIGAGPHCSGQVLVYHDLLGMMQHPHHAKVTPKFCKQYAKVGEVIQEALSAYREDVQSGNFPSAQFSPYKIEERELELFEKELENRGLVKSSSAARGNSSFS